MKSKLFRYITAKGLQSWEKIATKVLSEASRRYHYASLVTTPFTVEKNLFKTFHRDHDFFSIQRPLIGHVSASIEDISLTQKLLIDAFSIFEDPALLEQVTGEILAKVLAYRQLKKGMILYIPWVENNETSLQPCTVERVFNLWQSMLAFGIVPHDQKLPALILFRGTDLSLHNKSSRISIISNFDPKGPGYSVFLHAKPRLKEWLSQVTSHHRKAKCIGYSLGGALSTYLISHEPHYFSQTEHSLLFHHPGLTPEQLPLFFNAQRDYAFRIKAYVAEGDPVSKYGSLFCQTIGFQTPNTLLNPFKAHTQLFCALDEFMAQQIDIERENQCESRKFYSGLHQKTTKILHRLGVSYFLP
jgi:hypothetical protein